MEEQEKRLADFHAEQEAIKKRAADKHAEEKALREEQVKRLQVHTRLVRVSTYHVAFSDSPWTL